VGLRAGLDDMVNIKILPLPGIEPPAVQAVAMPALRNSCAYLNFPPGFKYSKYVENRI
jgi:hypothetical protein